MAEQKSIVLAAVVLAMVVAGGAFYFFMGAPDEVQPDESGNEAQGEVVVAEELAAQLDEMEILNKEKQLSEGVASVSEAALSLAEEQVAESSAVDNGMTADEPAVLGAETVEPTAETGVSSVMAALMGLAAVIGFAGVVVSYRLSS